MFSIGAFGIITDERGHVLLCHRRDYDLWNLPGGAVEIAETPWAAVEREVLEETALIVEATQLLGVYSKPEQGDLVFSFRCEVVSGSIAPTEEADDIRYFPVDRLPKNLSVKQAERIRDACDHGEKPVLKEQSGPSSRSWAKRR